MSPAHGDVLILTGSPGTGKTTLAARLAAASPRGLHVPSDIFYTFPARPISPYRAEAGAQNADIIVALTRTAATFASRGWDVVLDGIFGPWFLPLMTDELRPTGLAVEYLVLRAPLDVTLARVQGRSGHDQDHVVRKMHGEFSRLGRYERHALEVVDRTPEELAAEVQRRRATGALVLDLARVSSDGST
jgi:predicted kinase